MSYSSLLEIDSGELSIIELPLYSDLSYSYSTTLEQKTFTLIITWNTFSESWNFSLNDEDDEPLLTNQALVYSFPIDLPIASGLEGYLLLEPISSNSKGKWDTLKWDLSSNYSLYFVTKTSLL